MCLQRVEKGRERASEWNFQLNRMPSIGLTCELDRANQHQAARANGRQTSAKLISVAGLTPAPVGRVWLSGMGEMCRFRFRFRVGDKAKRAATLGLLLLLQFASQNSSQCCEPTGRQPAASLSVAPGAQAEIEDFIGQSSKAEVSFWLQGAAKQQLDLGAASR